MRYRLYYSRTHVRFSCSWIFSRKEPCGSSIFIFSTGQPSFSLIFFSFLFFSYFNQFDFLPVALFSSRHSNVLFPCFFSIRRLRFLSETAFNFIAILFSHVIRGLYTCRYQFGVRRGAETILEGQFFPCIIILSIRVLTHSLSGWWWSGSENN